MKRHLLLLFIFLISVLSSRSQESSIKFDKVSKALLEEFELLNLCHCMEYLMLRNYDYVKWSSEEARKRNFDKEKLLVFGPYTSKRQFGLFYQQKYDSTFFYKKGISIVLEDTNLNFKRLDSLYYEPLVQHYVKEEAKMASIPYLGIRHNNFFWDCFHKIKKIPLEQELEHFMRSNSKK